MNRRGCLYILVRLSWSWGCCGRQVEYYLLLPLGYILMPLLNTCKSLLLSGWLAKLPLCYCFRHLLPLPSLWPNRYSERRQQQIWGKYKRKLAVMDMPPSINLMPRSTVTIKSQLHLSGVQSFSSPDRTLRPLPKALVPLIQMTLQTEQCNPTFRQHQSKGNSSR